MEEKHHKSREEMTKALIESIGNTNTPEKEKMELIKFAKSLLRESTTDDLTGMYRDYVFRELLANGLAKISRDKGGKISVVYTDLDKFKDINDYLNHDIGNEVLRHYAKVCRRVFHRKTDIGGRMGGDEFAYMLVNTPKKHAYGLTKKLLERIEGRKKAYIRLAKRRTEDHKLPENEREIYKKSIDVIKNLSASAGLSLATYKRIKEMEPDYLIREAEQDMYRTKRRKYGSVSSR